MLTTFINPKARVNPLESMNNRAANDNPLSR
jgi:hypothetical protein